MRSGRADAVVIGAGAAGLAAARAPAAGDLDRVSAQWLASAAGGTDASQRQYRLAEGYFGIVEWLRSGLDPQRARVRLACVVEEVRWRRGEVEVGYRSAAGSQRRSLRARAAI